ncbi:hypothetical protein [Lysobacter gummosus]|uniref:hypothetical protein n=1 Tax=Lysobacter gummosus TaxID=262324 RepID=UPI00362E5EE3
MIPYRTIGLLLHLWGQRQIPPTIWPRGRALSRLDESRSQARRIRPGPWRWCLTG